MTSKPPREAPPPVHYICNGRIPGPRAHALHAAMMCEALAEAGARVCLFHPARRGGAAGREGRGGEGSRAEEGTLHAARPGDDWPAIAAHYDLRARFEARRIPCLDWIDAVAPRWQRIPFLIESWSFARGVRRELAQRPPGILYVRDPQSLIHVAGRARAAVARARAASRSLRLVYEAHTFPQRDLGRRAMSRLLPGIDALVVLTRALAEDYRAAGAEPARILVEPDAMQPRWFEGLGDPASARRRLGLPEGLPLVGYAGSLLPWKGVATLVDAVLRIADTGLLIVGGSREERAGLLARIPSSQRGRFFLLDRVAPPDVALHLRAADLLALPNTSRERISSHYTSPLKLFEYLASGTPVVASDLPSVREVVTGGESALLVRPDDPEALAEGILGLLGDPQRARGLAARGQAIARRHTWSRRAERILEFLCGLGVIPDGEDR